MKEKKKLSLPIKIFIGMALGIIAGLIFAFAHLGEFTKDWIKPIGTIYVNLLKFLLFPFTGTQTVTPLRGSGFLRALFLFSPSYAGNEMTSLSGGSSFGCFSSGCMALSTVPMSR